MQPTRRQVHQQAPYTQLVIFWELGDEPPTEDAIILEIDNDGEKLHKDQASSIEKSDEFTRRSSKDP